METELGWMHYKKQKQKYQVEISNYLTYHKFEWVAYEQKDICRMWDLL